MSSSNIMILCLILKRHPTKAVQHYLMVSCFDDDVSFDSRDNFRLILYDVSHFASNSRKSSSIINVSFLDINLDIKQDGKVKSKLAEENCWLEEETFVSLSGKNQSDSEGKKEDFFYSLLWNPSITELFSCHKTSLLSLQFRFPLLCCHSTVLFLFVVVHPYPLVLYLNKWRNTCMNTKSVSQSKHQEHAFPFADLKIVIFNSSPRKMKILKRDDLLTPWLKTAINNQTYRAYEDALVQD